MAIVPWKRGTAAQRALNVEVPEAGLVGVEHDTGAIVVADGVKPWRLLKRLLPVFADENLQVASGSDVYLDATLDAAGKVSEGTLTDGTKVIPKLRATLISLGTTVFNAATPPILDSDIGIGTGYSKVFVDSAGKIAEDALDDSGKVPAWILAAWSSRMNLTAPFAVLIVAGQSNSVERSSTLPGTSFSDPRIWQYNPTSGAIVQANANSPEWIGNAFAREFVRRNPSRRILIVPCGEGSTGFTTTSLASPPAGYYTSGSPSVQGTWDRTLTSDPINHYARMIARAQAAKTAAGAGAEYLGILWSQGETDRGRLNQSQYSAKLDDLIAQARTDLAVSDLPVVIGSMTPETIWDNSVSGTAEINLALQDTPRRVVRTSYIYGPADMPETSADRLHWSPQGQAIRARWMENQGMYRARLNVAASNPIPPQNIRIIRSGDAVTISWDHAPCRVSTYVLETSIDSGATWTGQTLTAPLASEHAMTVTAGTPVWARMKTTNTIGTTNPTREVKA